MYYQNWLYTAVQAKLCILSPSCIWSDFNNIVIYHTYRFSQVNTKTQISDSKIENEEKWRRKSFLLSFSPPPFWKLNEDSISYSGSLCSENITMTNLNYIIENLNGRLSCDVLSHDRPERPLEVALVRLVQGRSRLSWYWYMGLHLERGIQWLKTLALTLPWITPHP